MTEATCRMCGCSENDACVDDERGACSWAEPGLCSHCDDTIKVVAGLARGVSRFGAEHCVLSPYHMLQLDKMLQHQLVPTHTPVGLVRAVAAGKGQIFPSDIINADTGGRFTRKAIYNALDYLVRTGELRRIGYSSYRAVPR